MIKTNAISRSLLPFVRMTNKLLACFVVIAASMASVRVAAQAPSERYRNELQPLIEDFMHQQQIPGFAIGVIQDDRLVYAHGFGVKNLSTTTIPSRHARCSIWRPSQRRSWPRLSCSWWRRAKLI